MKPKTPFLIRFAQPASSSERGPSEPSTMMTKVQNETTDDQ
jgi:hypothetical protein